MEERQTLKPCPFCGSISIDVMEHVTRAGWPHIYSVECRGCDCSTYAYASREKAVNTWNQRKRPFKSTCKIVSMLIDAVINQALDTQIQCEFSYLCGKCEGLFNWLYCIEGNGMPDKIKEIAETGVTGRDDLKKVQAFIRSSILTSD